MKTNIYYLPGASDSLKVFQFGSGENHVQLVGPPPADRVQIRYRYTGDSSFMQLLMLTDALKRAGVRDIELSIPYFPGARQDRVCNAGETLSVKVYADLINAQGYSRVTIFDPHSDVVVALLDRVKVVNNHDFIRSWCLGWICYADVLLVSPDAGSNKKIYALAQRLHGLPVIRADKTRDVRDGSITGTEVFCGDLTGKVALIVDDICAGGRTFIELAKKLKEKNAERVLLAVSHYEGTADVVKLKASGIDTVYTTNSINSLSRTGFLHVTDIWSLLT